MNYALLGSGNLFNTVKSFVDERTPPTSVISGPFVIPEQGTSVPELGISVGYRYILKPEQIKAFRYGVINLHTGYLPWNRGAYPNIWPIIDGTPAGVTLHWIDAGVDTGPIIAQVPVTVEPTDTAGSLYVKLQHAAFDLFTLMWPRILKLDLMGTMQNGEGTTHTKAELETLDANVPGFKEVLDRIRARTFPGYGLDFDGLRVTVNIEPTDEV